MTTLIHSKTARSNGWLSIPASQETVIDDSLNFIEKLKLIHETITEVSDNGKFYHTFKMKRDPHIANELLIRGYQFKQYSVDTAIITWY
jgi:hypothetical protein